jgi:hypothetical protein
MEVFVVFAFYGLLGVIGLAIAFAVYTRSVSHRRWYECPQCGERARVELMRAGNCNTCGAPLRQTAGD